MFTLIFRRHWRAMLLITVLLAAAAIPLTRDLRQRKVPELTSAEAEFESVLTELFADEACLTAAEVEENVAMELERLALNDWTVVRPPGVVASSCVGYSPHFDRNELQLIGALRPEVLVALDQLRTDLLDRCVGKDDAVRALRTAVEDVGEKEFEIRTDGPVGAPPEEYAEVESHVKAGCFVYSTTGWTEDGVRIYYLAGLP